MEDKNSSEGEDVSAFRPENEKSVALYTGNDGEIERQRQDLAYNDIMKNSMKSSSTLLLPSVLVSMKVQKKFLLNFLFQLSQVLTLSVLSSLFKMFKQKLRMPCL